MHEPCRHCVILECQVSSNCKETEVFISYIRLKDVESEISQTSKGQITFCSSYIYAAFFNDESGLLLAYRILHSGIVDGRDTFLQCYEQAQLDLLEVPGQEIHKARVHHLVT